MQQGGFIGTLVAAFMNVVERQRLPGIHLKFRTIRRRAARRSRGNLGIFSVAHRCQMASRRIVIWIHRIDFFFFVGSRQMDTAYSPRAHRAHRHARYFCETTLRYRARMHASATCYPRALYPGTHQTSMCSIFVNVFFFSRCIRPVRLFH